MLLQIFLEKSGYIFLVPKITYRMHWITWNKHWCYLYRFELSEIEHLSVQNICYYLTYRQPYKNLFLRRTDNSQAFYISRSILKSKRKRKIMWHMHESRAVGIIERYSRTLAWGHDLYSGLQEMRLSG